MNNSIQVCKKDLCVNAQGEYADRIAKAVTFSILLLGLAALIKALN
jgi:hypothetical protein